MSDIEQRARDALNAPFKWTGQRGHFDPALEAMCREIEAHDATKAELAEFKREVSDAVKRAVDDCGHDGLRKAYIHARFFHFIIAKPDPLVEAVNEAWGWRGPHPDVTENLRAALAARGLEIREKQ